MEIEYESCTTPLFVGGTPAESARANEAARTIYGALVEYRIRKAGIPCPCGDQPAQCHHLDGNGELRERLWNWMLEQEITRRTPVEFAAFLRHYAPKLVRSAHRILQVVLDKGDEHTAALMAFPYLARAYRSKYVGCLLYELARRNYVGSLGVLRGWPELAAVPIADHVVGVAENLHSPLIRWLVCSANYIPFALTGCPILTTSAEGDAMEMDDVGDVGIPSAVKAAEISVGARMRAAMLLITRFWIFRVRRRIRRWRDNSRSLFHGAPLCQAGSGHADNLLRLLKRTPTFVPDATTQLIDAVMESPVRARRYLQHLTSSRYPLYPVPVRRRVQRWLEFLLDQRTDAANGAIRLLFRFSDRTDATWYVDSVDRILRHARRSDDRFDTHYSQLLYDRLHEMISGKVFVPFEDAYYILRDALGLLHQPAEILHLLVEIWAEYDDGTDTQEMNALMAAPAIVEFMKAAGRKERAAFMEHVAEKIVVGNRDRLIECWKSKHPLASTRVLREEIEDMLAEAAACRERFLVLAIYRHRRSKARLAHALSCSRCSHAFSALARAAAKKWRALQLQECYVCMTAGGEDGCGMVPLHMDMRHAICRKCRDAVMCSTAECPMCRKPIGVCDKNDSDDDDLTSIDYTDSSESAGTGALSDPIEGEEDPADYDDMDYLD